MLTTPVLVPETTKEVSHLCSVAQTRDYKDGDSVHPSTTIEDSLFKDADPFERHQVKM